MSKTKSRGTHGLRKRCPLCKKLRRFFEPQEGSLVAAKQRQSNYEKGWRKREGRWVCFRCTSPLIHEHYDYDRHHDDGEM